MSLESDWAAATPVQADWEKATPVSDEPAVKKRRRGDMSGEPIAGALEPLLTMATGAVAKPLSDIAGLGAIPLHALGITQTDPTEVKNIVQSGMTYQPRSEVGKSEANPLNFIPQAIGRGINWVGEGAGNLAAKAVPDSYPNAQDAVRHGVTEAVNEAPMFLGARAPAAGGAVKNALQSTEGFGARKIMQSALKPTTEALRTGKGDAAVNTLLQEGVNVTRGGAEKLSSRIEKLDDLVDQAVSGSSATVSKDAIVAKLWPEYQRAVKDVNPQASIESITKSWDDFVDHPLLADKTDIPVQLAQEMKRATNRAIADAAYGAQILPQITRNKKALVRGMKDEIATAVPEVGPLNAEMSPLINARDMVQRRALQEGNTNPLGIGLIGSLTHLPAWLADRSGLAKSLIARMLYQTGEAIPGMEVAGPAGGVAATFEADQAARKKRLAELLGRQQ